MSSPRKQDYFRIRDLYRSSSEIQLENKLSFGLVKVNSMRIACEYA